MGNLHDLRVVFIDNDTRMLFATVFDGTWDSYIDDFASKMPDQLDALFAEAEDYPGIHRPQQPRITSSRTRSRRTSSTARTPMPPSGRSGRASACSKPGKSCWTPRRSDNRRALLRRTRLLRRRVNKVRGATPAKVC